MESTHNQLDKKIVSFIEKHWVMTLATVETNNPWCCSLFYVFQPEDISFIFTSDMDTLHAKQMLVNPQVAAAIALETTMVGKIRGVQINGTVRQLEGEEFTNARKRYVKRFPVAALANLTLWKLEATLIKLTDNRLGFGKKLLWMRYQDKRQE